jgi:hypothetical protein
VQDALIGEVFIATNDLGHDVDNDWFREFLFLVDVSGEVTVRTVFHDHIEVGFSFEDIVAAEDIVVSEFSVNFHLTFKEFNLRWIEIFKLNHLYRISLKLLSLLHSLVHLAAIALT